MNREDLRTMRQTAFWAHVEELMGCVPHGAEDWEENPSIENTTLHKASQFLDIWLNDSYWELAIQWSMMMENKSAIEATDSALFDAWNEFERGKRK